MPTQRAPPTKQRTRAKQRPYQQKKRTGFLDLPGEIRNEIYAYCFEDEIWIDMTPNASHVLRASSIRRDAAPRNPSSSITPSPAAHPSSNAPGTPGLPTGGGHPADSGTVSRNNNNNSAVLTITISKKPQKIKYRRHTNKTCPPPPTNWALTPGALTRTNRQIHVEALPFFYAQLFFIFSAPNALLHFVRKALPPTKLALVRKLHVAHATYGDPFNAEHEVWKKCSDSTWAQAMSEAAARLTGLRVLQVRLVVNERPLVFGMDVWWVKTLMAWREREGLQATVSVQSPELGRRYIMAPIVGQAMAELHRLFSEALRKRLEGLGEAEAMTEYNEVKFGKWKRVVELYPLP